ncbi:MAG: M48 family metallopeptidase [Elusimicrobiota bacterium]
MNPVWKGVLRRWAPWPALAAGALAACQTVPYTGRSQLLLVSSGEEKKMGEQAYQETLKKSKISTDTASADLIRRVGRRLSKSADKPDFLWEFNLIEDDKQINAWCLPGGKVAFYTGIMPVTKGEDGVAVVMGHEIAHALARHGAARMSQGMLANFGGQALSVLTAKQPGQARALYEQAYGLGVGLGIMLPYSRSQESEADYIGLALMVKAGYDPAQAVLFWKRMQAATESQSDNSPMAKFLRTHPTSDDRRKKIEEWLPEIRQKYSKN